MNRIKFKKDRYRILCMNDRSILNSIDTKFMLKEDKTIEENLNM